MRQAPFLQLGHPNTIVINSPQVLRSHLTQLGANKTCLALVCKHDPNKAIKELTHHRWRWHPRLLDTSGSSAIDERDC